MITHNGITLELPQNHITHTANQSFRVAQDAIVLFRKPIPFHEQMNIHSKVIESAAYEWMIENAKKELSLIK